MVDVLQQSELRPNFFNKFPLLEGVAGSSKDGYVRKGTGKKKERKKKKKINKKNSSVFMGFWNFVGFFEHLA